MNNDSATRDANGGLKATVAAPSNIAFVKYWGIRDRERILPFNPSISMTLSRCVSRCTVEHLRDGRDHEIFFREPGGSFEPAAEAFAAGVASHLDQLRNWAQVEGTFRVATENSFPTGAGMASSASGFAALTLATVAALGRTIDQAEASRLARLSGSGSAARSVMGGFVEWPAAEGPESAGESAVAQLASSAHWDLCDVVAVVDSSAKKISSREGHRRAPTSPYWERRLETLPERLERVRRAISERSLEALGPVLEEEAVDLHLIAMSSRPPIFYWTPGTISVLRLLRNLRRAGHAVYATIDAGPNVHVICEPQDQEVLVAELREDPNVEELITDRVGDGPRELREHLR